MIYEDRATDKIQYNSKEIFKYIFRNGAITKANLGLLLDKNMTSVNRILSPLVEQSLIVPIKKGSSTGGRKPIIFDINSDRYFIGCINISSTYFEVGIINLKMEMKQIYQSKLSSEDIADIVLSDIIKILKNQIKQLKINEENFLGIGISVFASINEKSKKLIRPLFMYPHRSWLDIDLIAKLGEAFNVPVELSKGTDAATMLEYLFGVGKGNSKFIKILCAMNIRSAVIYDNKIINNTPYCEDSFGHMIVDFDGKKCFCGNYGCLATYVTIPSIEKRFIAELKKGRDSKLSLSSDEINFDLICQAVNDGDNLAIEIIEEAATIMGVALSNYINLFSPDVVSLSGLIIKKCPLFYEKATKTAIKKSALIPHEKTVKFVSGSTFNNPITTGAGLMLIEKLLTTENKYF
jgi:predicted NBD/HSP70 family sugar kinase